MWVGVGLRILDLGNGMSKDRNGKSVPSDLYSSELEMGSRKPWRRTPKELHPYLGAI